MNKFKTAIIVFIFSALQLVLAEVPQPPLVDYKLDECYFLGGANGVSGDVLDSTTPIYSATSVNRIDSDQTDAKICRSGAFGNGSYAVVDDPFTLGTDWTMSVWINFPFVQTGKQYYILGSYPSRGDLPVFQYKNNTTLEWGIYDNNGGLSWNSIDNSLTGWHHLTFVNAGSTTKLFVDGVPINTIDRGTSGTVQYLWASSDDLIGQSIASNIDEMKIFGSALTNDQISTVFSNEDNGNNYDGTIRDCPSCTTTTIKGGTWELISIPAGLDQKNVTMGNLFATQFTGSHTSGDWKVYHRDYSDQNNSASYKELGILDTLQFGTGYWLGSKNDEAWNVDDLDPVTYSAITGCVSSECVEIPLTPVAKNFDAPDNDVDDGSGAYRYNLSGHLALRKPVDWADCRFVIDGTVYTPTEAETAGYAHKQIWLYAPNASGVNGNGYTTCDDSTPGDCLLLPFKGFWVKLHGSTKGKTVKLLIPKE